MELLVANRLCINKMLSSDEGGAGVSSKKCAAGVQNLDLPIEGPYGDSTRLKSAQRLNGESPTDMQPLGSFGSACRVGAFRRQTSPQRCWRTPSLLLRDVPRVDLHVGRLGRWGIQNEIA
jgi:hypothetical protein